VAKKKLDLTNVFAPTGGQQEPGATPDYLTDEQLNKGRIVSAGVGLKQGEVNAFDALAGELGEGITRNALMRLALRWWLRQVREGRIDLNQFVVEPPKPKKRIVIPGTEEEE
jgi:hypothetical protein